MNSLIVDENGVIIEKMRIGGLAGDCLRRRY